MKNDRPGRFEGTAVKKQVWAILKKGIQKKDFERIQLKKAETKTVSFLIISDKLQFFITNMKRVIEPLKMY